MEFTKAKGSELWSHLVKPFILTFLTAAENGAKKFGNLTCARCNRVSPTATEINTKLILLTLRSPKRRAAAFFIMLCSTIDSTWRPHHQSHVPDKTIFMLSNFSCLQAARVIDLAANGSARHARSSRRKIVVALCCLCGRCSLTRPATLYP